MSSAIESLMALLETADIDDGRPPVAADRRPWRITYRFGRDGSCACLFGRPCGRCASGGPRVDTARLAAAP